MVDASLRQATGRQLRTDPSEALDFVPLTTIDTLESTDKMSIEMLLQITGDRGNFVEGIRREYWQVRRASARAIAPFSYS